jgi:serine/threonine protein kinase
VFRGTYLNTPVAIKEMITRSSGGGGGGGADAARVAADRAEDDSFIKEFENLKSLRHPNVVQFFGAACASNVDTAEQRRVLVMELAACSLKDVVRGDKVPQGGYPVVTSLNWALQVAAGLRYIHDRRMIHFDIKVIKFTCVCACVCV